MLHNDPLSTLTAMKFVECFMRLDAEGFANMLADNVSSVNCRIQSGGEDKHVYFGKINVVQAYNEKFFEITRDCILTKAKFKGEDLHASLLCKVIESKKEENNWQKYDIVCYTKLDFIQVGGQELKIIKIWQETSKKPI